MDNPPQIDLDSTENAAQALIDALTHNGAIRADNEVMTQRLHMDACAGIHPAPNREDGTQGFHDTYPNGALFASLTEALGAPKHEPLQPSADLDLISDIDGPAYEGPQNP